MWNSILFALLIAILILISGWLSLLISLLSISFGSRIPFLYMFLGLYFGMGKMFPNGLSYWPTYLFGLGAAVIVLFISIKFDEMKINANPSTVSTCASSFVILSIIGMLISLFL